MARPVETRAESIARSGIHFLKHSKKLITLVRLVRDVQGMALNCIHIFIVTGSFYADVSWGRPVSASSYTVVFIYESWSYLI